MTFKTFFILLVITVFPIFIVAEELRNDGWENGETASTQSGFTSGDIGAVRLVPTILGNWPLQNVQLLFNGDLSTRTIILHIWDDSSQSNDPGSEIYSGSYQLAGTGSNTTIHEIDLSLMNIIVSGIIRIGIEFTHNGIPSIASDTDGDINASRNFIYTGGTWNKSEDFGLSGDWIIRANTNTAVQNKGLVAIISYLLN